MTRTHKAEWTREPAKTVALERRIVVNKAAISALELRVARDPKAEREHARQMNERYNREQGMGRPRWPMFNNA